MNFLLSPLYKLMGQVLSSPLYKELEALGDEVASQVQTGSGQDPRAHSLCPRLGAGQMPLPWKGAELTVPLAFPPFPPEVSQ